MPVTINELVVTVEVAPSDSGTIQNTAPAISQEIMQKILENVMEVINHKKER